MRGSKRIKSTIRALRDQGPRAGQLRHIILFTFNLVKGIIGWAWGTALDLWYWLWDTIADLITG